MSASTILQEMLYKEENKICGDCHTKSPRWTSWNIGVFLCIRCAGIHRNLGVHISKVKSVNLDSWTNEQISHFKKYGNQNVNQLYEANLPEDFTRPKDDSSVEKFIRNKYIKKLYYSEAPSTTDSNNKQSSNKIINSQTQDQVNKKSEFDTVHVTKNTDQQHSSNLLFSNDYVSSVVKTNINRTVEPNQIFTSQNNMNNFNNNNMFGNSGPNDLMSFDQSNQKIDQLKNQISFIQQSQNQFQGSNSHPVSPQNFVNSQQMWPNQQQQQQFNRTNNQETDLLKDESKILKETIMNLYNQPQMMPGYNQFNGPLQVGQYGMMPNQQFNPSNMNQVYGIPNQMNYPTAMSSNQNMNQFNMNRFNNMQSSFNPMNKNMNSMQTNQNSSLSNNLWK